MSAVEDGRWHVTGREHSLYSGMPTGRLRYACTSMSIVVMLGARPCTPSFMGTQKPVRLPRVALCEMGEPYCGAAAADQASLEDSINLGTNREEQPPLTAVRSGPLLD